jgi:hypothetical protein
MVGPQSLGAILEHLLKKPGTLIFELVRGQGRITGWLTLVGLVSLAIFGALLGTFSGGSQVLAAAGKVALGSVLSALICLPSFYIFTCLCGGTLRLNSAIGLITGMLAMMGIILVALAPVVWLFCQATHSIQFMGVLALGFWACSLGLGYRFLRQAAPHIGIERSGAVQFLWMAIFSTVTLQMATNLRPILGTSDTLFPTVKRFFLENWTEN